MSSQLPHGDRGIHHPGTGQLPHITHPQKLSHTPHPAHMLYHSFAGFSLARSLCTHTLWSPTPSLCAPPHPSGLQPPCRADSGCHRGGRSTPGGKGSRRWPRSGHSDPRSDRARGCTSLPASGGEAVSVSAQGPPRTAPQLLQGPRQAPTLDQPSKFLPQAPGDAAHLALRAGEALWAGAAEARVGSTADAPMQTGPREAGVSLVLAVCTRVARTALAAERVHAVHAGPTVEAGARGEVRNGSGSAPMQAPPSWPLPTPKGHSSVTPPPTRSCSPSRGPAPSCPLAPTYQVLQSYGGSHVEAPP